MPFVSASTANNQIDGMILQADAATNSGRFIVRQDYGRIVGDYLYRECPLWSVLRKEPAEAEIVKEIRYGSLPVSGFTNKRSLDQSPNQPAGNRYDLTDPGQTVKALTGFVDWSHFDRSLAQQQGNPYGDTVAKDTSDLIVSICQDLEYALFNGDATAGSGYEFNGLANLMPTTGHLYTASYVDNPPDHIGQKLAEIITRVSSNRRYRRKISVILTNGCGMNLLQLENESRRMVLEKTEFLPGIQVPGIMSDYGVIPIQCTPFVDAIPAAGETPGRIVFWLLDLDQLVWKGVYPFMGMQNFDPQIFEVSMYVSNVPLTEKRLGVCYGTLYGMNQGDGIWKLEVDAPDNLIWTQNG